VYVSINRSDGESPVMWGAECVRWGVGGPNRSGDGKTIGHLGTGLVEKTFVRTASCVRGRVIGGKNDMCAGVRRHVA
jgi:hypothetical protein